MENNKKLSNKKQCDIHAVIPRFIVGATVKIIVSKNEGKIYRQERKGTKGIIENTGISLNRRCYWVNFGDHNSWIYEDDLNVLS